MRTSGNSRCVAASCAFKANGFLFNLLCNDLHTFWKVSFSILIYLTYSPGNISMFYTYFSPLTNTYFVHLSISCFSQIQ